MAGTPHSINQKRRISGIKIAPENRSLEGQKWYQSVFFCLPIFLSESGFVCDQFQIIVSIRTLSRQSICRLITDSTRLTLHIKVLDNMVSSFLVTWPSNRRKKKWYCRSTKQFWTQIGQGISWFVYSTPGRASKKISLYFSPESSVVRRPAKEGQSFRCIRA